LVASYTNRKPNQREESFKTAEESVNKKGGRAHNGGCPICDDHHRANDCPYRNKKFSVESNKWYYEKYVKNKKASDEDSEETTASSVKDDEEDDRDKEQEPKLAEENIKASKGTVARKTTFKTETANYCREVKPEVAAAIRVLTSETAIEQAYLMDDELANAMKRKEKAAVRTTAEPTAKPEKAKMEQVYITTEDEILTLDEEHVSWRELSKNPDKYWVIESEEELTKARAQRKYSVPLKGGDTEKIEEGDTQKIKGGGQANYKDNPDEGEDWIKKTKKKKLKKQK
jgi:hypothetical protein